MLLPLKPLTDASSGPLATFLGRSQPPPRCVAIATVAACCLLGLVRLNFATPPSPPPAAFAHCSTRSQGDPAPPLRPP